VCVEDVGSIFLQSYCTNPFLIWRGNRQAGEHRSGFIFGLVFSVHLHLHLFGLEMACWDVEEWDVVRSDSFVSRYLLLVLQTTWVI